MSETKIYCDGSRSWIHDFLCNPGINNEESVIVNMIVEIPKKTNKKMEMSVYELYNPIKQDKKRGKPRLVPAQKHKGVESDFKDLPIFDESSIGDEKHKELCIKYGIGKYRDIFEDDFNGYNLFSYGAIPQTFENDNIMLDDDRNKDLFQPLKPLLGEDIKKVKGDGDPLDICLLNDEKTRKIGDIVPVKVIGVFPMIDENEIDWKIVATDINSEPPTDEQIFKAKCWFKYYKDDDKDQPKGEKVKIGEMVKDILFVKKVINHCKKDYKDIINTEFSENNFIRQDGDIKKKPEKNAYQLYKSYIGLKKGLVKPIEKEVCLPAKINAFPKTVDGVFADHSYQEFDITEINIIEDDKKKPLKVITANGGSIFHKTKGINDNFNLFNNKIYGKEENYDLIEAMINLVYGLFKSEEYKKKKSLKNIEYESEDIFVNELGLILEKLNKNRKNLFDEESTDYDRFEKLIKNLKNFYVLDENKQEPFTKGDIENYFDSQLQSILDNLNKGHKGGSVNERSETNRPEGDEAKLEQEIKDHEQAQNLAESDVRIQTLEEIKGKTIKEALDIICSIKDINGDGEIKHEEGLTHLAKIKNNPLSHFLFIIYNFRNNFLEKNTELSDKRKKHELINEDIDGFGNMFTKIITIFNKYLGKKKKKKEKSSNIHTIISEENNKEGLKQYALFRDLPGLFKAQTTGGFEIEISNPYNTKENYLNKLLTLAEKCDVLILTEGIQINMDLIQEPKQPMEDYIKTKKNYDKDKEIAEANKKLFEKILTEYKIKSLNHFDIDKKYQETTNVIYLSSNYYDCEIKNLTNIDPSSSGKKGPNINLLNSSLITMSNNKDKFSYTIMNIHGPSDGVLTPLSLKDIYISNSDDNNKIKYICGDGNMEDYYSLEGRQYLQEDFEKEFGNNIELKVADFMIIKKRPFAMPFINNQFWKGSDPEKYDVQFALILNDILLADSLIQQDMAFGFHSSGVAEDLGDAEGEVKRKVEEGVDEEEVNREDEGEVDGVAEDSGEVKRKVEEGVDEEGVKEGEVEDSGEDDEDFGTNTSMLGNSYIDIYQHDASLLSSSNQHPQSYEIGGGSRKKTKKKYKLNKISIKKNRYKNSLKNKLSMKNKKHRTKKRRKRVL